MKHSSLVNLLLFVMLLAVPTVLTQHAYAEGGNACTWCQIRCQNIPGCSCKAECSTGPTKNPEPTGPAVPGTPKEPKKVKVDCNDTVSTYRITHMINDSHNLYFVDGRQIRIE